MGGLRETSDEDRNNPGRCPSLMFPWKRQSEGHLAPALKVFCSLVFREGN